MFNQAVITQKGIVLANKVQAGLATTKFTKLKLGAGKHNENELDKADCLLNERQSFPFSSIEIINENTVRLRCVTTNEGITEGYNIGEIAVIAKDPEEGEIVYSIATGMSGKMDYQPSYIEMNNYELTIDIYCSVSNTDTVYIEMGKGAVASAEDLKKAVDDFTIHKKNKMIHIMDTERTKWDTVTNKVDKIEGKQLSANDYTDAEKNKLSGIAEGANKYTHPGTHPASMITQDADHQFVTDGEKKEWNGKVTASGGDISETVVGTLDSITESFPIPAAKEKLRTFLGKVRKNLQDWKNLKDTLLTLSRLVNNGQTTASGYALDARYGKTLYDLYAKLNSDMTVKSTDISGTYVNISICKILNIVHVICVAQPKRTIPKNSERLNCAIPVEYTPMVNLNDSVTWADGGIICTAIRDGKMYVSSSYDVSSPLWYFAKFTYFTKQ